MKVNKRSEQQGFTVLETIITLAIFSVVLGIACNFLFQYWAHQKYLSQTNFLRKQIQVTLDKLSRQLSLSRRILSNDTIGNEYRSMLPFSVAERNLMIFPTIRQTGSLTPEKTCDNFPDNFFWGPSVGNALFFVESVANFDNFTSLPTIRAVDLYRFSLYYVKAETNTSYRIDRWNSPSTMQPLRLVEWHSQIYADYHQYRGYLQALSTSAQRTTVRNQLQTQGVVALWDARETVKANFFVDFMTDPAVRTNKGNTYTLESRSTENALRLTSSQDANYSIAYNRQPVQAQAFYFPIKTTVPAFFTNTPTPNASSCGGAAVPATAPTYYSGPANAFPGGFEVAITGPNSGRSVLLNLTVMAQGAGRTSVEQNHHTVTYAKDF